MTEFAVMPEGTKILPGDRVTLVVTVPEDGSMRVQSRDEDIRVVERPIPEPELPTVPGYYESANYPTSHGWFAYRLKNSGKWYAPRGEVTEKQMRALMPLTRLVPEAAPAKLADRIDPKSLGKRVRLIGRAETYKTWAEDAEALIAAIDNGELDL